MKAMIDGKNKLRRCQEMLNNFGSIDARNLSSVNTIKQSEESIPQTEEHGFVNAYLKIQSSKETMFYKTKDVKVLKLMLFLG
jgi:hypothetical protein